MTNYEFLQNQVRERPRTGGCWQWPYGQRGRGYGAVFVAGKRTMAHQVAFVLAHGPIGSGLVVRHTCDNPGCFNPAHLVAGTMTDNSRDAVERGRRANGWGPTGNDKVCKRGHLRSDANSYAYLASDGRVFRQCRECDRMIRRERYRRVGKKRNTKGDQIVDQLSEVVGKKRAVKKGGE